MRWRTEGKRHGIQEAGRGGIFSDYHLRVCEVTSDTHPPHGIAVVEQRFDTTEIGAAKTLSITEFSPSQHATFSATPDLVPSLLGFDPCGDAVVEYDIFESIYNAGKMLLLASWTSPDPAALRQPESFAGVAELRHRRMRNIRDYGMYERREAAQYYPDVAR